MVRLLAPGRLLMSASWDVGMLALGSPSHQLPCCLLLIATALLCALAQCALHLNAGLGASKTATEVLWSDPAKAPGLFANESRGVGLIFGPDITKVSRASCCLAQAEPAGMQHLLCTGRAACFLQSMAAEQLWQCMVLHLQACFELLSSAVQAMPVCIF